MTKSNGSAMTPKLTLAQTEAFYSAYRAYREGKKWDADRIRKDTLRRFMAMKIIQYRNPQNNYWWECDFAPDKGLPLAIELGFPARYDAEKQAAAAQQQSDDEQQAAYRKLLEIPDTIATPRINDRGLRGITLWIVRFTMGIIIDGHINYDDKAIYYIRMNDIRLESTADVTGFLKEMYVAITLLTKLQTGLIRKAETPPYEPSALAILPNRVVGK